MYGGNLYTWRHFIHGEGHYRVVSMDRSQVPFIECFHQSQPPSGNMRLLSTLPYMEVVGLYMPVHVEVNVGQCRVSADGSYFL